MNVYASFVRSLIKNPRDILSELNHYDTNLLHMSIGVVGEASEMLEMVKKGVFNGHVIDREKFVKELGDIEFYLEGLRQHFGITREEIIEGNISKLIARYPNGYSDVSSIVRADNDQST